VSGPALETRALHKRYRAGWRRRSVQEALRGVDLAVPRGIAFGLIGPNGAGKTTFLKALLGIVSPTGGEVRVLDGAPEDPAVRARIGYLPERLHVPPLLSAVAFLRSVARLKGLRRIDPLAELARVGLLADAHRKCGTYSKGMKQRLGLAAALLGEPELLLLDEPTDGVDPLGRVEIRQILQQERARGATLFLNSHLLAETERLCDRVGILNGGKIVREGTLDDLRGVSTRWRVRFAAGADAGAVAAAGFTNGEGPGVWLFDDPDAARLNAALDRARGAGALVVEVAPFVRDLEAVLADAVSGEAPA
jgi:ABC-2 type transport system ATP-binding protein